MYSVGFNLPAHTPDLLERIPAHAWVPALDAHDEVRDGAWVAEVTDLLALKNWPQGMRVIVRKERPHPGAQLTITDVDGHRITAFATNTPTGGPGTQLPDLELRHRRRARCEDRIRIAKDIGLRAFPLFDFTQNQIWCAIVTLAVELTAWMQMLALHDHDARRWEPKRLRLRLFIIPATLAHRPARAAPPRRQVALGWSGPTSHHPAPRPGRPGLSSAPPGPTTPAPHPAPGSGAHPRRHSGPCHTPARESHRDDGHRAVTVKHRHPTKDSG